MLELLQLLGKVTPALLTGVGTTIRIANEPYIALAVENIGPARGTFLPFRSATMESRTASRAREIGSGSIS